MFMMFKTWPIIKTVIRYFVEIYGYSLDLLTQQNNVAAAVSLLQLNKLTYTFNVSDLKLLTGLFDVASTIGRNLFYISGVQAHTKNKQMQTLYR